MYSSLLNGYYFEFLQIRSFSQIWVIFTLKRCSVVCHCAAVMACYCPNCYVFSYFEEKSGSFLNLVFPECMHRKKKKDIKECLLKKVLYKVISPILIQFDGSFDCILVDATTTQGNLDFLEIHLQT